MLGKICNSCTIDNWEFTRTTKYELYEIAQELKKYMHELTNLFDECLGKVSNDEVLQSIFSTFCVGK